MKKFLIKSKFPLFILIFFPLFSIINIAIAQSLGGQPIVPCDGPNCTIQHLFNMIGNIYRFIVWDIATPVAIFCLLVGGIILLISAGNPNLSVLGKKILISTVIGIVLVFGSWLIVNTILFALRGKGL